MTYFKATAIRDPFVDDHQAYVSEFNALRAVGIVRLVGTTFVGASKDTNFWTETVTGTGTVTQTAGTIALATGATANSTTQYQTVRIARFVPGQDNVCRVICQLGDTGVANNTRNWGAFNANNGFFFQLTGTTLNIVSRKGGVDTATAKASWNGPGATAFTFNTNVHVYEIVMTYADVYFYIDHILVHSIVGENGTTFVTQSLDLPVTLQNNNSGGGTANVSLTAIVAFIARSGVLGTETKGAYLTGAVTSTLKIGSGRLHRVVWDVGGNAGTLTLYDNTSAAVPIIGLISAQANAAPISLEFGCPFFTGLTAVTTGASTNVTVIYE